VPPTGALVPGSASPAVTGVSTTEGTLPGTGTDPALAVRRYFGTVSLDPTRVGRDAGRIAEEVIAHLVGQVGAEVTVKLEIAADLPSGASDQVKYRVIAPIGFDPIAAPLRHARGIDHDAVLPLADEIAVDPKPARAGFVDEPQPSVRRAQRPDHLRHRLRSPGITP